MQRRTGFHLPFPAHTAPVTPVNAVAASVPASAPSHGPPLPSLPVSPPSCMGTSFPLLSASLSPPPKIFPVTTLSLYTNLINLPPSTTPFYPFFYLFPLLSLIITHPSYLHLPHFRACISVLSKNLWGDQLLWAASAPRPTGYPLDWVRFFTLKARGRVSFCHPETVRLSSATGSRLRMVRTICVM
jgi:hypothetical protein